MDTPGCPFVLGVGLLLAGALGYLLMHLLG